MDGLFGLGSLAKAPELLHSVCFVMRELFFLGSLGAAVLAMLEKRRAADRLAGSTLLWLGGVFGFFWPPSTPVNEPRTGLFALNDGWTWLLLIAGLAVLVCAINVNHRRRARRHAR